MKIVYGIDKIKKYKRPVVALGVFDGVHIGHRYILRAAVNKAQAISGTAVAVTFYPDPQKEQSLYSLKHRLRLIAELGIDVCIIIKFTPAFSRIEAQDFIRKIIVQKINAGFIYIGKNFRFGKSAKGDANLLKNLAKLYDYKLKIFEVIRKNRFPVSSTYIRNLITHGNLALAGRLLSRPVTVLGTVIKGASLARRIGFPTANINPHHEILPPSGVYAVKVILDNRILHGICNIGSKPTLLERRKEKHVEVYIFDFKRNIYGKDLEIQFLKKIRNEKKFPALKDLAGQIEKDIKRAENILSA